MHFRLRLLLPVLLPFLSSPRRHRFRRLPQRRRGSPQSPQWIALCWWSTRRRSPAPPSASASCSPPTQRRPRTSCAGAPSSSIGGLCPTAIIERRWRSFVSRTCFRHRLLLTSGRWCSCSTFEWRETGNVFATAGERLSRPRAAMRTTRPTRSAARSCWRWAIAAAAWSVMRSACCGAWARGSSWPSSTSTQSKLRRRMANALRHAQVRRKASQESQRRCSAACGRLTSTRWLPRRRRATRTSVQASSMEMPRTTEPATLTPAAALRLAAQIAISGREIAISNRGTQRRRCTCSS
mmetsp:Transcript_52400/g.120443  ORF Transcript_52400/g.120443 Transcript_52400/m.120443 type:complete len:295 (-) Transcript_52400:284-1168(-)